MLHPNYYVEKAKVDKLIARKNVVSDIYNGIYDRYEYPVLTREFAPVHWRYDLNPETNPYFMERLGINAVLNSGAIYLNGKFYLVVRVEGADRKSFFAVAESDTGIDGFHFWDYPISLPDTCPEETNVYDMRLTQHEDGWIYGVFCSESKDTSDPDLSAAVAAAGIVRTKDLKNWSACPTSRPCARPSSATWSCIRSSSTESTPSTPGPWTASSRRVPARASALACARTSPIPSSTRRR